MGEVRSGVRNGVGLSVSFVRAGTGKMSKANTAAAAGGAPAKVNGRGNVFLNAQAEIIMNVNFSSSIRKGIGIILKGLVGFTIPNELCDNKYP